MRAGRLVGEDSFVGDEAANTELTGSGLHDSGRWVEGLIGRDLVLSVGGLVALLLAPECQIVIQKTEITQTKICTQSLIHRSNVTYGFVPLNAYGFGLF